MAKELKKVQFKSYQLLKDVPETQKCPPQCRLILNTIKAAGGTMTRDDLIMMLKRPVEQGGLKTNQTAERIFGFYRPKLTLSGVLKELVSEKEVEVEVPDKPAPAAKVAAAAQAGQAPAATPAGGAAPAHAPAQEVKHKGGEKK
jgi:hypothetical protein